MSDQQREPYTNLTEGMVSAFFWHWRRGTPIHDPVCGDMTVVDLIRFQDNTGRYLRIVYSDGHEQVCRIEGGEQ